MDGQRRRLRAGPSSSATGVTFNDGSPFEADDVVASIERVVDPKSGSGALAALQGILSPGGTKAVDTATVEFTLDKPFADFPYLVCQSSYNTVMLPRDLRRRLRQEPGRHRSLHARLVQRQAEGRHGQEPHLLGQGRRRQRASVPRLGHLGHGAGRVRRQPAAAVGRRGLPAADGLPGFAGALRRHEPARRRLSRLRHPRGRVQPPEGAVEERRPRSFARPSPTASTATPSTRLCTTGAACSATTPSGSPRSSRATRTRLCARRTTPRPRSCSPPPGSPTASRSS